MLKLTSVVITLFTGCTIVFGFNVPNCYDNRTVIVHLFNWKHEDVALECERWLGPKGFCGVQVSPPNKHVEYRGSADAYRPWWERYQPVSYKLESRSGNRMQFRDMVRRCEAQRVRIYADVVVNHMSGSEESGFGSGGSYFDAPTLNYTGVPYTSDDFNCCFNKGSGNCETGAVCYTETCGISDYNNPQEVRDCRLVGDVALVELAVHLDYVKEQIKAYLNDMIDIGVAGFRVDACKHMWPSHLEELFNDLVLPDGSQPFIFNEVIDLGSEAIKGDEYFHLGRVTEFKYCNHMFGAFRSYFPLADLESFGEAWGMYQDENALVFVDNHDNQRGHGAGGADILTFWEPRLYKMAVIFAIAHPYGFVRIMSSYRWPGGRFENDARDPPTNDGDDIKTVVINSDESCDDGSEHTWVCEHRWSMIANMVEWRNVVGSGNWVENWWTNGGHQIAFSRAGKAFIAINNEEFDMTQSLYTGMPTGTYCDIISGNKVNGTCTGVEISVDEEGYVDIDITGGDEDPIIAIHIGDGSLITFG